MLDDYGLEVGVVKGTGEAALTSRATYILPAVDKAAGEAAEALKIPVRRVLVYMVNTAVIVEGDQPSPPSPQPFHLPLTRDPSSVLGEGAGGGGGVATQPTTGPRMPHPNTCRGTMRRITRWWRG